MSIATVAQMSKQLLLMAGVTRVAFNASRECKRLAAIRQPGFEIGGGTCPDQISRYLSEQAGLGFASPGEEWLQKLPMRQSRQ